MFLLRDFGGKLVKSKLFNNIFYLLLLQGVGYIFPILLIPFLVSTIGIEKYGLVNFAIALVWYFQIITEFGFDLSNVKHVVGNKNNPQKISEILSVIVTTRFVFSLILFVFYLCIIFLFDKHREYTELYIIAYVRVFASAFLPYWLFRSLEKVKEVTKISLLVRTVSILPIFLVVSDENDYLWVMFFMVLNEVLAAIVAMRKVLKTYKLKFYPFRLYVCYLKDSVPFFTSNILIRLYTNSNMVVLGFFSTPYWTGIYSVAEKLYNAYNYIVAPLIQYVFYPYFVRVKDFVRVNRIILVAISLNVVLLFVVYLLAPVVFDVWIKKDTDIIKGCFTLFLLLLCVDVPAKFLGYPYCGMTDNIAKLNKSTFIATLLHFTGLAFLLVFKLLSAQNIILLLIFTQTFNLGYRILFLRKYLFVSRYGSKNK